MGACGRVCVDFLVELSKETILEGQIITEGLYFARSIGVELGRQIDGMPQIQGRAAPNRVDVEGKTTDDEAEERDGENQQRFLDEVQNWFTPHPVGLLNRPCLGG
jgi:hypothetical protein